jgi:hypothetical protein
MRSHWTAQLRASGIRIHPLTSLSCTVQTDKLWKKWQNLADFVIHCGRKGQRAIEALSANQIPLTAGTFRFLAGLSGSQQQEVCGILLSGNKKEVQRAKDVATNMKATGRYNVGLLSDVIPQTHVHATRKTPGEVELVRSSVTPSAFKVNTGGVDAVDATWEQIQKCPFWQDVDACYHIHRKRLATPRFSCDVVGSDAADGATLSSIIRFGEDHNSGLTTGLDFDVCSLVAMLDPTVPIPTIVSARTYGAALIFLPIGMYVVRRAAARCLCVYLCYQLRHSILVLILVLVSCAGDPWSVQSPQVMQLLASQGTPLVILGCWADISPWLTWIHDLECFAGWFQYKIVLYCLDKSAPRLRPEYIFGEFHMLFLTPWKLPKEVYFRSMVRRAAARLVAFSFCCHPAPSPTAFSLSADPAFYQLWWKLARSGGSGIRPVGFGGQDRWTSCGGAVKAKGRGGGKSNSTQVDYVCGAH